MSESALKPLADPSSGGKGWPDFDDIRRSARNLAQQSGGEIKIEEWQNNGENCLKIVMTWKIGLVKYSGRGNVLASDQGF